MTVDDGDTDLPGERRAHQSVGESLRAMVDDVDLPRRGQLAAAWLDGYLAGLSDRLPGEAADPTLDAASARASMLELHEK